MKHFDYNYLRNAFRKVLLEQLTSRINDYDGENVTFHYTRHEDNKQLPKPFLP